MLVSDSRDIIPEEPVEPVAPWFWPNERHSS